MAEKITKAAFVSNVAEKLELSVKNTDEIINVISKEIADLLKNGKNLSLPKLGSFSVKDRPARTGRNPSTGKELKIAACKVARFKPSKELKESMNS